MEELFGYELERVLDNIDDPNTVADKKRVITIEVSITPTKSREHAGVEIKCKSKLVGTDPAQSVVHLSQKDGKLRAFGPDAEQIEIPGTTTLAIAPDTGTGD